MSKKKAKPVEQVGGTVAVKALVSFSLFLGDVPIAVGEGTTAEVPIAVADGLVRAGHAEVVEKTND